MTVSDNKEVYFNLYCKSYAHVDVKGEDDPCDECLSTPDKHIFT